MDGTSKKRIIILKNIDSEDIEEAILILKNGCVKSSKDGIISQAEQIIDDYVFREKYNKKPGCPTARKRRGKDIFNNLFLISCGIGLLYVIFKIL